jgi:hypothetical protein
MAIQEHIEALKVDKNVFELVEDTEIEYLVHFAAPTRRSRQTLWGGCTAVNPKTVAKTIHDCIKFITFAA